MFNKVILVGRLGQDPEYNDYGSSEKCDFSMATTSHSNGEEYTEWHNINVWGNAARANADNLSKGDLVLVEGRKQTSSYTGDDGQKKYSTSINAYKVQWLDTSGGGSSAGGGNPDPDFEESFDNDDIPF